jgi:hypothetical protein
VKLKLTGRRVRNFADRRSRWVKRCRSLLAGDFTTAFVSTLAPPTVRRYGFPKFFMDLRPASVVCTSNRQAQVRAVTTTVITVFAIDAATSRCSGGSAF